MQTYKYEQIYAHAHARTHMRKRTCTPTSRRAHMFPIAQRQAW